MIISIKSQETIKNGDERKYFFAAITSLNNNGKCEISRYDDFDKYSESYQRVRVKIIIKKYKIISN